MIELGSYSNLAEHALFHSQTSKRVGAFFIGGSIVTIQDLEKGRRPDMGVADLLFDKIPKAEMIKERIGNIDTLTITDPETGLTIFRDAGDLTYKQWGYLTEQIASAINQYHLILLVMGSDTAERVAPALTFGLAGKSGLDGSKGEIFSPIILVTSLKSMDDPITDAPTQVSDALSGGIIASDRRISEVMITANHDGYYRGTRFTKITATSFNMYKSHSPQVVGEIDATAGNPLDGVHFTSYARRIRGADNFPTRSTQQSVQANFAGGIESIVLDGVGRKKARIHLVEDDDCTGLVIYAHGVGTGPVSDEDTEIVSVIEKARNLGKPVIVTTSIAGGVVNLDAYYPGRAMKEAGAIGTCRMTPGTATAKLAFLMGHERYKQEGLTFIDKYFPINLVGEMNERDVEIAA